MPLVVGQIEPDEFSVAVDASFHDEIANFFGDPECFCDENGLVCRDQEVQPCWAHGLPSPPRLVLHLRDAPPRCNHEDEHRVDLVRVATESRPQRLLLQQMEKLGVPVVVRVPEEEPVIPRRIVRRLGEPLSNHAVHVVGKLLLRNERRLRLESGRDVLQLGGDELQRLDSLVRLDEVHADPDCGCNHAEIRKDPGAVCDGLAHDLHGGDEPVEPIGHLVRPGRKVIDPAREFIGLGQRVSNLDEAGAGFDGLDDGGGIGEELGGCFDGPAFDPLVLEYDREEAVFPHGDVIVNNESMCRFDFRFSGVYERVGCRTAKMKKKKGTKTTCSC